MLNFGAHCTLQFVTNGTMRGGLPSYDPEIGATRWVEGIIREIKLYPFSGNISQGISCPVGKSDFIADVQQRGEMETKLEGPSQVTTKKNRGRLKKIPGPPTPSPDEEEGIVTRSHIGKLAKMNEVQLKAATTKSPVQKVTPYPFSHIEQGMT